MVGVAADDTLNVRSGPGVDFDIVAEIAPLATGVIATGHIDGPAVGDLGEITVDVLDFPDDAQLGERLHIFADPGDESFTLRSVERTMLCRRGVSDGSCH